MTRTRTRWTLLLIAAWLLPAGSARAQASTQYRVQEPTYCANYRGCPLMRRNAIMRAMNFCQAEGGVRTGDRVNDFRCQQSGIYCVVTGRIVCNGRMDPRGVPGATTTQAAPRGDRTCLEEDCTRYVDHAPGYREEGFHACRPGFAMVGISAEGLDLVCEAIQAPRIELRAEGKTMRQGLRACPLGQYVIGVSDDRSELLCAQLPNPLSDEQVQDETGQLGLQVCESDLETPRFVSGLDEGRQKLLCGAPPQ